MCILGNGVSELQSYFANDDFLEISIGRPSFRNDHAAGSMLHHGQLQQRFAYFLSGNSQAVSLTSRRHISRESNGPRILIHLMASRPLVRCQTLLENIHLTLHFIDFTSFLHCHWLCDPRFSGFELHECIRRASWRVITRMTKTECFPVLTSTREAFPILPTPCSSYMVLILARDPDLPQLGSPRDILPKPCPFSSARCDSAFAKASHSQSPQTPALPNHIRPLNSTLSLFLSASSLPLLRPSCSSATIYSPLLSPVSSSTLSAHSYASRTLR